MFRGYVNEGYIFIGFFVSEEIQSKKETYFLKGSIVYESVPPPESINLFMFPLGTIFTAGPLDREFNYHYWLTVVAVDLGSVPLSSVAEIYIEVTDINDNPPQMSSPILYSSVVENSPPNTSILQVEATDPDFSSQGKLTFQIISGNHQGFFVINPVTGKEQSLVIYLFSYLFRTFLCLLL